MPTRTDRPRPRNETGPGGDDLPPRGEEARAQRKATRLPWIWLLGGILLVAIFCALLARPSSFNRSAIDKAAAGIGPMLSQPDHKARN